MTRSRPVDYDALPDVPTSLGFGAVSMHDSFPEFAKGRIGAVLEEPPWLN